MNDVCCCSAPGVVVVTDVRAFMSRECPVPNKYRPKHCLTRKVETRVRPRVRQSSALPAAIAAFARIRPE